MRRAIVLLRYGTRVFEDLVALLVQEKMIVAEVRARDVPVKVLCDMSARDWPNAILGYVPMSLSRCRDGT